MVRLRRAILLGPILAVAVAFSFALQAVGQQATPQSQVVQNEDTRAFPVSIHQGTCDQLGQVAYQLAPIGLPQGGQLVSAPATPAYESITTIPSVTLDTFVNGQYAIPVSKSSVEIDTIVACGLVGGARYGDNLLFSLPPMNDQPFTAVVKMTQDQSGVTVTIHLVTTAGAPATPAAASPVASPAAGVPATPPIGSAPASTSTSGQSEDSTNQQTVTMVDIAFQPTELTVPANTDVTIALTNAGASVHNFNIDELNIHSGDIQPGQSGNVTINAAPGDYEYYCSVPGHKEAGMVGTLHIQ